MNDEFSKDDELHIELDRLQRELRAANEDHYRLAEALDAERDKRRQLTRRLEEALREFGLW